MLIAVYLIYAIIVGVLSSIPVIGQIVVIFVAPPLVGGAVIVGLKAVRGDTPEINELFSGFRKYWFWMGVYWLFAAILLLTMIPLFIAGALAGIMSSLGAQPDISPAGIAMMVVAGLVSLVLYAIFGLRYMFAYYHAADGAEIVESFKKSEEMTRDIRLTLLGVVIVLGLFAAVGVLACGVGVVLTGLLSSLALVHIYVALKGDPVQPAVPQNAQV